MSRSRSASRAFRVTDHPICRSNAASSAISATLRRPRKPHIDTTRDARVLLGVPSGATMPNDMGTFRVDMELENPAKPGVKRALNSVLVDTGAELSWVPVEVLESLGVERNNQWRFRQREGSVVDRPAGLLRHAE